MPARSKLDQAITRLARNMAITRVAMDTGQVAALFPLNLAALHSAIEGLALELANTPPGTPIRLPSGDVIESPIADLLAETIGTPTPDHLPDSWKD